MTLRLTTLYILTLFCALIVGNIFLAAYFPLTADEAHYALYAQFLDWSYFDHPPLTGWLQALVLNFGDSDLLLRVLPLVIGLSTFAVLLSIVKQWYGAQLALFAGLVFFFSPLMKLLTVVWLPETPLLLAGLGVLYFTDKIAQEEQWRHYTGLGILLGLAALSKYTAITLVVSVIGTLVMVRSWHILLSPKLWVSGLIAGIFTLPILYWNWQHGWISFSYQVDHGTGREGVNWLNMARMQVGQFIAFGPLLYSMLWLVLCRPKVKRTPRDKMFLWFSLPILLLFSLAALKGRSLPHWTLLGMVFMLPLVAQEIVHRWSSTLFRVFFAIVSTLTVVVWLGVHLILGGWNPGFKDFQHPLQDFIGWKTVSKSTMNLAKESGITAIAIPNWSNASRIAWYARPLSVHVLDTRFDQFDLWFGTLPMGRDAYVILTHSEEISRSTYLGQFSHCDSVNIAPFYNGETQVNSFSTYRCTGYKGPQ